MKLQTYEVWDLEIAPRDRCLCSRACRECEIGYSIRSEKPTGTLIDLPLANRAAWSTYLEDRGFISERVKIVGCAEKVKGTVYVVLRRGNGMPLFKLSPI